MDVREKLIEILRKPIFPHELVDQTEAVADYLLDNGVTIQEWISVDDSLPERTLPPKDVLVYHDLGCGMFVDRAWYSYYKKRWCSVLGMKLKVTHWMPLPEPPKGE